MGRYRTEQCVPLNASSASSGPGLHLPRARVPDENGSATRNMPESAWDSAASLRPRGRQMRRNHRLCEKRWPGNCPGSTRGSITRSPRSRRPRRYARCEMPRRSWASSKKKEVTGKPDDIERVTSGLAGGRRERSRKTTSPAAYPTTSARTSSETVGGDDELHRVYKIHRFVVKDLRGKSRAHSVCGCAFFLGDRSIRDPSR